MNWFHVKSVWQENSENSTLWKLKRIRDSCQYQILSISQHYIVSTFALFRQLFIVEKKTFWKTFLFISLHLPISTKSYIHATIQLWIQFNFWGIVMQCCQLTVWKLQEIAFAIYFHTLSWQHWKLTLLLTIASKMAFSCSGLFQASAIFIFICKI